MLLDAIRLNRSFRALEKALDYMEIAEQTRKELDSALLSANSEDNSRFIQKLMREEARLNGLVDKHLARSRRYLDKAKRFDRLGSER